MTDHERGGATHARSDGREAQIRRKVFEEIDQANHYQIRAEDALRFGDVALPWRLLDEARAEIARLRDEENTESFLDNVDAALKTRAPPDAAAMELIDRILSPRIWGNGERPRYEDTRSALVRALTEYGDYRAREARAAAIEQCKAIAREHQAPSVLRAIADLADTPPQSEGGER